MATPDMSIVRKYAAAHGFTSNAARAIVDDLGNGVAPSWDFFARMHAATIAAWAEANPAALTVRSGSSGAGSPRTSYERAPLPVGTVLTTNYKGSKRTCTVEAGENGSLAYVLDDGQRFPSPSAAGQAVMGPGSKCSGWVFWKAPNAITAVRKHGTGRTFLNIPTPGKYGPSVVRYFCFICREDVYLPTFGITVCPNEHPDQNESCESQSSPKLYRWPCACPDGFTAPRRSPGSEPNRCPVCDERPSGPSISLTPEEEESITSQEQEEQPDEEPETEQEPEQPEEQPTVTVESAGSLKADGTLTVEYLPKQGRRGRKAHAAAIIEATSI